MQSQFFIAALLREVSAQKKMSLNKTLVQLVFGDCSLVSVLFQPHRHPQLCSMEAASALKMPACSPFTVRVAFSSHKSHVELL